MLTGYMHGYTSLARVYRLGKSLSNLQKRRLGFHTLITPSHPTITETMRCLNPEEFQDASSSIIQLNLKGELKQIAIDGKSLRSAHNSADRMLHLVSAYAVEACAVLAQEKSKIAGGEIHSAANLYDALKEGYYGKF